MTRRLIILLLVLLPPACPIAAKDQIKVVGANTTVLGDHGARRATAASPPVPASKPGASLCLIKGNVSRHGRIYHVPGSTYYSRTKINRAGERWFCTVEEAEAAGFRAPLR